ncbi:MAG: DinB family protein [Anaerolineales bacterium]|nr:DinB family protein [Anaerolineales bacterium]
MTVDRSFIELNNASRERMRKLAEGLTDEQMQTKVGEHWTVSIVYVHLAWWERRTLVVLDMTEKAGKLTYPELDVVINDISLPLWEVIPPRDAVRIALESAEAVDKRLETYPETLLEEVHNQYRRWVFRADHRNEHLGEAETALKK